METQRWRKLQDLFHQAAAMQASVRRVFLDEACRGDQHLRSDIDSLLDCENDSNHYLDSPAFGPIFSNLTAADSAPAYAGASISHYKVIERIGEGGMGVIYKAEDTNLGRPVALKFLAGASGDLTQAIERLRREAHVASSLDHPNICTVHEIGEHDGEPFIAMQFLEGQNLTRVIAGNPVGSRTLLEVAIQIADGLQAAHHAGIIHRDIKPANIFLTNRGRVKILDFGIAKFQASFAESSPAEPDAFDPSAPRVTPLTRTGALIGTVAYMSPEQVRGEQLDARTDLFSFGAVLYEMATGSAPFHGATAADVSNKIVRSHPAPPSRLNPAIPSQLSKIIGRMLEKDRELRYQRASDIAADLRRLTAKRNTLLSSALAAATVLIVIASAVFWIARSQFGNPPEILERQLTANPTDNWVSGAAISPDGKRFAFNDQTGTFIRNIDSGETRQVPLSPWFRNRIDDLRWFPDGKRLLVPVYKEGSDVWNPDIWVVSALGETPPRRIFQDKYCTGTVSPDGKLVAFIGSDLRRGVWVASLDGRWEKQLRSLGPLKWAFSTAWSPDGQWVAYFYAILTPQGAAISIDVQNVRGGPPKSVVSQSDLPAGTIPCYTEGRGSCLVWSPDWRLMFTTTVDAEGSSFGLWALPVQPGTAQPAGKVRKLKEWHNLGPLSPSISRDGKHLLMMRESRWPDIYLASLTKDGSIAGAPRRFTSDTRGSYTPVWTPDSQAIVYTSDRTGKGQVFRQAINDPVAKPIIQSAHANVGHAVTTPDGRWLLYGERAPNRMLTQLMRQRTTGGLPELAIEEPAKVSWEYACPISTGLQCVLSEFTEGDKYVIFYSLDPLRGKGPELAKIDAPTSSTSGDWAVSPDASAVAYTKGSWQIEVLTIKDGRRREIQLPQPWEHPQSIAWAADGSSVYVTSWLPDAYDILRVTLAGATARVLHIPHGGDRWRSVTNLALSPDGRYLAFERTSVDSNVWMLDKF